MITLIALSILAAFVSIFAVDLIVLALMAVQFIREFNKQETTHGIHSERSYSKGNPNRD